MAAPVVYHNSPSAGYIRWDAFSIQYQGVGYSIPPGNTNERFVWWKYNTGGGTTAIQAGPDIPPLTGDDLVLLGNKNGTAIRIMATTLLDGDLLVDGSVFTNALAADSVTAAKIKSDEIETRHLKVGSVTTAALAASSVTAAQLTVGAISDNSIINGSFEDGVTGWAMGEANGTINLVTGVVGASGANAVSISKSASGAGNVQLVQGGPQYFPVSAVTGRSWYFSLRAGAASALASGLVFRVHWFQADRVAAASTAYQDIYVGGVTATMTPYEGQLTPPGNAKYGRISVYNTLAGSTFYVDEISANEVVTSIMIGNGQVKAAQILAGEIGTNHLTAGAVTATKLNVTVGGGNLATNSNFRVDTTGWSISKGGGTVAGALARVAGAGPSGTMAADALQWTQAADTGTVSWNLISGPTLPALTVGEKYVASFYVKRVSGATGLVVQLANASNANNPGLVGTTVPLTAAWTRIVLPFTATATGAGGYSWYIGRSPSSALGADVVQFAGFQLEAGDVPSSYAPRTDEILPGTIIGTMINATAIDGKVITGATIQTSSGTGARVVQGAGGLIAYNSSNAPVTTISSATGAITATSATITGAITATSGSITGDMGVTGNLFAGASATTGARTVMTAGGLVGYDSGNVARTTISSATGALTATNVSVSGTITATAGSISGDLRVSGSVYVGASPTSGARIRLMSSGLIAYDSASAPVTTIDGSTGAFTSTSATISGVITGSTVIGGSIAVAQGTAASFSQDWETASGTTPPSGWTRTVIEAAGTGGGIDFPSLGNPGVAVRLASATGVLVGDDNEQILSSSITGQDFDVSFDYRWTGTPAGTLGPNLAIMLRGDATSRYSSQPDGTVRVRLIDGNVYVYDGASGYLNAGKPNADPDTWYRYRIILRGQTLTVTRSDLLGNVLTTYNFSLTTASRIGIVAFAAATGYSSSYPVQSILVDNLTVDRLKTGFAVGADGATAIERLVVGTSVSGPDPLLPSDLVTKVYADAIKSRASHTGVPVANWSNGGFKITSLADGTVATDAVNKGQLDTKTTKVVCYRFMSTSSSGFNSGVDYKIPFDSLVESVGGVTYTDNGAGDRYFTIPTAGTYLITATVRWAGSYGLTVTTITVNNTAVSRSAENPAGWGAAVTHVGTIAAGAIVRVLAQQQSGAAASMTGDFGRDTAVKIVRISD